MYLSVVVPCFNEADCIQISASIILERLHRYQATEAINSYELILVDDGSEDETWKIIENLSEKTSSIKGVKLLYNKGHQNALLAGIDVAKGDAIITMDADLQDDLEVIGEMIEKYKIGNDIVYGVRTDRKSDSFFKRWSAQSFYFLIRFMGVPIVYNHADFRLISQKVKQILSHHNEKDVFLRALIPSFKLPSDTVSYSRMPRIQGETKYTLLKMVQFASNGITSFTTFPLTLLTFLGVLSLLLSIVFVFIVFYFKFFTDLTIQGWASIMLGIIFIAGVQMVSIGLLGLYIANIFQESKKRPNYIIEKVVS